MGRKSKKKEGSESSMTTKMKKYRRRVRGRKVISIIFDINVFKKIGICTYVLVGWEETLGRHEKKSKSIYRIVKLAEWATFLEVLYTIPTVGSV